MAASYSHTEGFSDNPNLSSELDAVVAKHYLTLADFPSQISSLRSQLAAIRAAIVAVQDDVDTKGQHLLQKQAELQQAESALQLASLEVSLGHSSSNAEVLLARVSAFDEAPLGRPDTPSEIRSFGNDLAALTLLVMPTSPLIRHADLAPARRAAVPVAAAILRLGPRAVRRLTRTTNTWLAASRQQADAVAGALLKQTLVPTSVCSQSSCGVFSSKSSEDPSQMQSGHDGLPAPDAIRSARQSATTAASAASAGAIDVPQIDASALVSAFIAHSTLCTAYDRLTAAWTARPAECPIPGFAEELAAQHWFLPTGLADYYRMNRLRQLGHLVEACEQVGVGVGGAASISASAHPNPHAPTPSNSTCVSEDPLRLAAGTFAIEMAVQHLGISPWGPELIGTHSGAGGGLPSPPRFLAQWQTATATALVSALRHSFDRRGANVPDHAERILALERRIVHFLHGCASLGFDPSMHFARISAIGAATYIDAMVDALSLRLCSLVEGLVSRQRGSANERAEAALHGAELASRAQRLLGVSTPEADVSAPEDSIVAVVSRPLISCIEFSAAWWQGVPNSRTEALSATVAGLERLIVQGLKSPLQDALSQPRPTSTPQCVAVEGTAMALRCLSAAHARVLPMVEAKLQAAFQTDAILANARTIFQATARYAVETLSNRTAMLARAAVVSSPRGEQQLVAFHSLVAGDAAPPTADHAFHASLSGLLIGPGSNPDPALTNPTSFLTPSPYAPKGDDEPTGPSHGALLAIEATRRALAVCGAELPPTDRLALIQHAISSATDALLLIFSTGTNAPVVGCPGRSKSDWTSKLISWPGVAQLSADLRLFEEEASALLEDQRNITSPGAECLQATASSTAADVPILPLEALTQFVTVLSRLASLDLSSNEVLKALCPRLSRAKLLALLSRVKVSSSGPGPRRQHLAAAIKALGK
jgi:hypothetical protein